MLLIATLARAVPRAGPRPPRRATRSVSSSRSRSAWPARPIVRDRSRSTPDARGARASASRIVVALGGSAQHARAAAGAWVGEVVPGDVLVTSIRPAATDEPAVVDLGEQPGVAAVSPIATFDLAVDGIRGRRRGDGRRRLSPMPAGSRSCRATGPRPSRALEPGGAAIVPASLADRLGLRGRRRADRGDRATRSTMRLRVAGIAERTLPGTDGETVLVGWTDAAGPLGVSAPTPSP